MPQLLIGAVGSGSGKTTLTMGLLRALRDRGLRVSPFKCGPDYIDPKYHALASGSESVNLDTWFSSPDYLRALYLRRTEGADVAVTEGVMGLFDGYRRMEGSSAEVARLLGIPVLLVVNARSTAYSAAPLIYGFSRFRPEVEVRGVVFNQVASERHLDMLREACEEAGVPCFGGLPRLREAELPSRHLGLTLEERYLFDGLAATVAEAVEQHVDLSRLLEHFTVPLCPPSAGQSASPPRTTARLRIAVARDEAFNFLYPENVEQLRRSGEVIFFSPLRDASLPAADFVYLPGGYPEFCLPRLEANLPMRQSVRRYAESGGRLLAECGGMMYLCRAITGMDGRSHAMCGVLPARATMEGMRLHIGYRTFEWNGQRYRGHEFHYSSIIEEEPLSSLVQQYDARGQQVATPLYRLGNVLAGYTHLYWGETHLFSLWDNTIVSPGD